MEISKIQTAREPVIRTSGIKSAMQNYHSPTKFGNK